MVNVLGWDIGGANTKVAYISTQNGFVSEFRSLLEYFPFWKQNIKQFCELLLSLKNSIAGSQTIDGIGVTLTAELSDAFYTKREGVNQILNCVNQVFAYVPVYVLDVNENLLSIEDAKNEPIRVSSANWVATGWMVSQYIKNCVIVDVGSTTTSIIPIINGKIVTNGKTDLEKLILGELVYTGSLRTNLAAIVQSVPIKGKIARVSSELFAQSGDIHLILGNIKETDYNSETTDGKGKTWSESAARLARIVCADTEMISDKEILDIARFVYTKQIEQISEAIMQVYSTLKIDARQSVPVVITGLGKNFLAKKGAEKAGIPQILDLAGLIPSDGTIISPSVGIALLTANKIEGRFSKWKQ